MKKHLLALTLFGLFFALANATAQEMSEHQTPFITQQTPNEWKSVPSLVTPFSKAAQAPPLDLRGGAVPNGLQGFYDYQSNGMSPGWIRVNPENLNEIHMVYMRANDGSSFENISPSRRVGYSISTDGGKNWGLVEDVSGNDTRLGFPYLGLANLQGEGPVVPVVAAHGDPDGSGIRTMFFSRLGILGNGFIPVYEMPRPTAGGRESDDGAGVVWPSFATRTDNQLVQEVIGSLSEPGEKEAPLQVSSADFAQETAAWKDLGDSVLTATSGGRYVIARSVSGKLGIAYHQFFDRGADTIARINFAESTDNGQTWNIDTIFDEEIVEFENQNGDEDTLLAGVSLDFAYMGDDPHIVFQRSINGFFRTQRISHWSRSTNKIVDIAMTDLDFLRGIRIHHRDIYQPGGVMGISYPSISLGNDGKHIVVAFMAQGQEDHIDPDSLRLIASDEGFPYQRIWMVGSKDGGVSWGATHVLQDWAGDDTDSASCEYPSLNETCRVDLETGEVTIDMAFQARRFPGMYAFIVENTGDGTSARRGPINETFQYFQRTVLGPAMFNSSLSSVEDDVIADNGLGITSVPNPAQRVVEIQYWLEKSGNLSINIFNTLGQKVKSVLNQRTSVGDYTTTVDISDLESGLYHVVLTLDNAKKSTALTVLN